MRMSTMIESLNELTENCKKVDEENNVLRAMLRAIKKENDILGDARSYYIVTLDERYQNEISGYKVIVSNKDGREMLSEMKADDLVFVKQKDVGIIGYGIAASAMNTIERNNEEVGIRMLSDYMPLSVKVSDSKIKEILDSENFFISESVTKLRYRSAKALLYKINRKFI